MPKETQGTVELSRFHPTAGAGREGGSTGRPGRQLSKQRYGHSNQSPPPVGWGPGRKDQRGWLVSKPRGLGPHTHTEARSETWTLLKELPS